MNIAIDIDYTIFYNNSILYKMANKLQTKVKSICKKEPLVLQPKDVKYIAQKKYRLNNVINALNASKYFEIRNAVKTINELYGQGHKIFIVSSRPKQILPLIKLTANLIENHNLKHHVLVVGCKNKAQFCKDNGIEMLIDDYAPHCLEANNFGIWGVCLTKFNQQPMEKNKKTFYVHSWKQIENVVNFLDYLKSQNVSLKNKTLQNYLSAPYSDPFINNLKNQIFNVIITPFKL